MKKGFIKLLQMAFIFVMLVVPFNVNAKSAPSSIYIQPVKKTTASYIGPYLYYDENIMADGRSAYCLEYMTPNPLGLNVTLKQKLDAGYTYLIANGYPAKSFTGNASMDSYLTQIAIYWYHDRANGISDSQDGMIPGWYKTQASDPHGLKPHIMNLLNGAMNALKNEKEETPTITAQGTGLTFSDDKKYFVSGPITVSGSSNMTSYTVSGNKDGLVILDENGQEKTTFGPNEKFTIKIPTGNLSKNESLTIQITGTFKYQHAYAYTAGSSYQTITPPELYDEEKTASTKLSFGVGYGKIIVSKVDGTTKKPLAGATLILKDKEGNIIKEWVTTTEKEEIDYLPYGEYTLEEKAAPSNYVLSKDILKITVSKEDGTKEIVMNNQPYVEVPNTGIKSGTVLTILGFVILTLGAGSVYVTNKN